MKKEERLNRLFGEIDDDLVADAAAKPIPLTVWLPRVTAAVAAVALTVGLAVAQPWASNKPPISNGGTITTITTTPQDNGVGNRNEPVEEVEPGVPIATDSHATESAVKMTLSRTRGELKTFLEKEGIAL